MPTRGGLLRTLVVAAAAVCTSAFGPSLVGLRNLPASSASLSNAGRTMLRLSQRSSPSIARTSLNKAAARKLSVGPVMKETQGGLALKYVTSDGTAIAYDYLPASKPTVVYLPSLNQTRHGSKASALQTWCKRNKQGFFAADYYGCGRSGGLYQDGTISRWVEDTVTLIDNVVKGPVLLVGAGIGGWIMMLVALRRPNLVKGLVGIAADPDFTTDVVLPELDENTKRKIKETGMATIVWGLNEYTISQKLIDDSRNCLLLNKGPKSVPITCSVRLIQGLGDEEIPPDRALKISDALVSEDVVITYVKFGDHLLDEDENFARMTGDVAELCQKIFEYDLSSPTSG